MNIDEFNHQCRIEQAERRREFLKAEQERTGICPGVKVQRRRAPKRGTNVVGTVERTYVRPNRNHTGDQATADILWHGNVRYLSGRRDQHSRVRFEDLTIAGD